MEILETKIGEYCFRGSRLCYTCSCLKTSSCSRVQPFEFIQTNIVGSNNLIEACISQKVKKSLLFLQIKLQHLLICMGQLNYVLINYLYQQTILSVKRYKILCSKIRECNDVRGSVLPIFLKDKTKGILNITDKKMTRFNITLEEGVNFVLFALKACVGQEKFVPKLPSYNIMNLARAVSSTAKIKITGIRKGENSTKK